MKLLTFLIGVFLCTNAFATNYPPTTPARVSIFSTTVDWEGVTGLSLHQYTGKIQGIDKDFVKQGLVLYYLDMFP